MKNKKQSTILNNIEFSNIGVHSGKKVNVKMFPAPPDTGIVFKRVDIENSDCIKLNYNKVKSAPLCTLIENNGVEIQTIEHLVAALSMCGVDNIYIEVDSKEIPIMDGSSMPFIYLIQQAGIKELRKPRSFIKIKKHLKVEDGDKYVEVKPSSDFIIDYTIDFEHPFIKETNSNLKINLYSEGVINSISRARTFGFMSDIEYLQKNNLALGGGFDNAIVLDEYKVLNNEELRYEDEFVRHKVLDMIGDLFVNGHYMLGEFKAYKSGHFMNNLILREIFSDVSNYELVSFDKEDPLLSQTKKSDQSSLVPL